MVMVSGFPVELASDDEDNVDALVAGLDAESNVAAYAPSRLFLPATGNI